MPGQTSCNNPEMLSLLKISTVNNTGYNDRTRLIAILLMIHHIHFMISDGPFKQMRGLVKVVTQRVPSWPCGLEIDATVNEGEEW